MFINRFAFKMYKGVSRPLQQLGSRRLFSCQNSCKLDSNINTQIKEMNDKIHDKIHGMFILQGFTYILSFLNFVI